MMRCPSGCRPSGAPAGSRDSSCPLRGLPHVRLRVGPVPLGDLQVVVGPQRAQLRCPLLVGIRGFLQRIGDPVGIGHRPAVVRIRMHVRRLALQGVGRRAASGAPGHRAAVGGLLVAGFLACRVGDRAVRVHRAVVRAGVLDRCFQPLLRHRHVEGETIERGAYQTAFGLRVVEVLRQFAEARERPRSPLRP